MGPHDETGIAYCAGYRIFSDFKGEEMTIFVFEHEGGLTGKVGCPEDAAITVNPVQLGILSTWIIEDYGPSIRKNIAVFEKVCVRSTLLKGSNHNTEVIPIAN